MSQAEKSFCVLSIDHHEADTSVQMAELEKIHGRLKFKHVCSLAELEEQLKRRHWNFVISNYQMKGFTALNALELLRKDHPELPFILFTESIGEEIVADMMKAGVEDVVLKSRPERLIPVVRRILREHETRAKEARAHKLASDAFAAKEQMLAIVSHDIKNPLSAIQLEAQMLLRAVERSGKSLLAEEVKIQANRILKTTDRIKILISDLLDRNKSENSLSHITKANVSAIRLIQEVLDALRPLIQDKEILVKTSVPSGMVCSMDRNKMFQVFSNLINNAIKFTPQNGTIEISSEETEHDFIFSVEDSGPGLSSDELKRVFEKYWTGAASASGTGLGLFICKTIVEAHGGHIFVENGGKQGARFRFTLQKISANMDKARFSYMEQRKDHRKKVYIIDDDEDLREVISWALGKEGYSIHAFHSPVEALDCLTRGKDMPDLIMVDFHMDEMKGSEFLLKKNKISSAKGCPVLMISASPQEVEKEVSPEDYKDIITKPIDLEGLVNNVRKSL